MMPWRVAESLAKLREQVNAAAPDRSKASDGTIGDAAHAASVSDHNPDTAGVVHAFDLTHDPKHGVDIAAIAEALRLSRDPRIKYVIANRRIFAGANGPSPWVWRDYTGTDPHTNHVHISVNTARADDRNPWQLATQTKDDLDMNATERKQLIDDIADAVVSRPVPRPGNKPVALGAQVGAANVNSYRTLAAVRALAHPDDVANAVVHALRTIDADLGDVDVDELARKIVVELGREDDEPEATS